MLELKEEESKTNPTEAEEYVVRMGRPRKPKPVMTYKKVPVEADYENETNKYLPFSNSIRADQYLQVKRLEHHGGRTIREIVEAALDLYLPTQQPLISQALPVEEAAKLKPLKTHREYYFEAQEKADARKAAEKAAAQKQKKTKA